MDNSNNHDRQAHKEALLAIALAVGYFIWWYISAYGFSAPPEETTLPELYWGMPLWFLLSCVIGPIVFTCLCAVMVKVFYRDIPLDVKPDQSNE
ncbi:YhdT family protein [Vibrio sp. ABG19]|uniref:YhdT family protein n=1 Tax=Vibrio sp. ABG19 TaxID=2817385 RepID=UPI00249DD5DE|nr:YhdT family protein [Vibrio sp. ABG19]WGY44877.1 YhdT family protein [Vibrio sp. ABG19]